MHITSLKSLEKHATEEKALKFRDQLNLPAHLSRIWRRLAQSNFMIRRASHAFAALSSCIAPLKQCARPGRARVVTARRSDPTQPEPSCVCR